jgi:glycosyltransferase involved in cell wall biosynthesis
MRSIVVPTYNEEERIVRCLEALLELDGVEIIISDDGSSDGTLETARSFLTDNKNVEVIGGGHKGKGAALIKGFDSCKGEVMGFLDADLSAKPSELERLFERVEDSKADLAIGSRELAESVLPIKQPFHRRLLGNGYSVFARLLFGVNVRDFQCGCKAFTRELWEAIDVKSEGFVFDTELIARAKAKGFRIKEEPITWTNDRRTKVHPVKDPITMFLGLIRIKLHMLKEKG